MHIEDDLSPEADRWLDEAGDEFNRKQATLQEEWLHQFYRWEFDPTTGELTLFHSDGAKSRAAGEILGSFSTQDKTWEWAWNNPQMPAQFSRKSLVVKDVGDRFGLEYLKSGIVPIPHDTEQMISYLCSIGVKATASCGIFRGGDDRLPVFFLVYEPRWYKVEA